MVRSWFLRSISYLRSVEVRFLLWVVLAVTAVWGFSVLLNSVVNSVDGTPGPIDQAVTDLLFGGRAASGGNGYPFGSHALADVARDVTALGSAFVLTFLVVTVIPYLFARHDRIGGFFLLAVVLGAALLSFLLKALIARERPDFASSYIFETSASFPSGHSLLSAALYPALAIIVARREVRSSIRLLFQVNALLVVLLVGASRVMLGAHYATDVMAGWIAGFFWVALCRIGLAYLDGHRKMSRQQ